LLASIGERALGLQASQLTAVVRWLRDDRQAGTVTIVAVGPRLSTVALVATAATERTIDHLELHGSLGSLKEVVLQNRSVGQMPEMFCFGLLESFDIKQLEHLANTPVIRIADSPASRPR